MINLIPNEERKRKLRDFYFRLAAVGFCVLGFSILVASAALLPAYFLSVARNGVVREKLALQEKEILPPEDQETDRILKDLRLKLETLEKIPEARVPVTEKVVAPLLEGKPETIKIERIYYQSGEKGSAVSVSGTADSREDLLSFRKILEQNPAYKKVDLPVSNFVQESNIKFFLNLIPS